MSVKYQFPNSVFKEVILFTCDNQHHFDWMNKWWNYEPASKYKRASVVIACESVSYS